MPAKRILVGFFMCKSSGFGPGTRLKMKRLRDFIITSVGSVSVHDKGGEGGRLQILVSNIGLLQRHVS